LFKVLPRILSPGKIFMIEEKAREESSLKTVGKAEWTRRHYIQDGRT
jgi:hypothetical protein